MLFGSPLTPLHGVGGQLRIVQFPGINLATNNAVNDLPALARGQPKNNLGATEWRNTPYSRSQRPTLLLAEMADSRSCLPHAVPVKLSPQTLALTELSALRDYALLALSDKNCAHHNSHLESISHQAMGGGESGDVTPPVSTETEL